MEIQEYQFTKQLQKGKQLVTLIKAMIISLQNAFTNYVDANPA